MKFFIVIGALCLASALGLPQNFPKRIGAFHHPGAKSFLKPTPAPIEDDFEEELLEELVAPKAPASIQNSFPAPQRSIPTSVQAPRNYVPSQHEREQAQSARYEFSADIDDHISDLSNQRTETREGLKTEGMYSYSDGYYKRTVHYVADENGYRVISMEAVPLDGPHIDLSGTASVSQAAHGASVHYKVQSVPFEGPVAKILDQF